MRKSVVMVGLAVALLACAAFVMAQSVTDPVAAKAPQGHGMGMMHGGAPGAGMHPAPGGRMGKGDGMAGCRCGMGGMHGPGGMGMGFGFGPWMLRGLDLNDAQREKLADIHERAQKKTIQSRADVEVAMVEMRRLARAERPDERAIEAQIDRIATLRAGIAKAHVAALFEARGVLTPEQLKKVHELREQGPGMHRGGPGGHHGQAGDDGDDEDMDDGS